MTQVPRERIAADADAFRVVVGCARDWMLSMAERGPKKRSPGQSNAQYDSSEVDPNPEFIEGSSGGLGWGRTDVGGYQPVFVRIVRTLARRREGRRDG